MRTQRVILLLGGNQGDVYGTMNAALLRISKLIGRIEKSSDVYSSEAWGPIPQPYYLNRAVSVQTIYTPGVVLSRLLEIEKQFGRVRKEKYGPRTLDIDIIFYGHRVIQSPTLKIPHPEMQNRRFVLMPCSEIMPVFMHPVLGKSIGALLADCPDKLEVKPWRQAIK